MTPYCNRFDDARAVTLCTGRTNALQLWTDVRLMSRNEVKSAAAASSYELLGTKCSMLCNIIALYLRSAV